MQGWAGLFRLMVVCGLVMTAAMAGAEGVVIAVDQDRVGMGRSVEVRARLRGVARAERVGRELHPYVNGRRWGAHEFTDAEGRAVFHLPLPNPGGARIEVVPVPARHGGAAEWIWPEQLEDSQAVFLQHAFTLRDPVDEATLWVAADDVAEVWINGTPVATQHGWQQTDANTPARDAFRIGENVVSVKGTNGAGPAGVVVRLELATKSGPVTVLSSPDWRGYTSEPAGWPGKAEEPPEPLVTHGAAPSSRWSASMATWPTAGHVRRRITGSVMPADAQPSNAVDIRVERRDLAYIPRDPDHLVGAQWEPWFTPRNADWSTAQAVPLMGFYRSYNPDVTRQQMLWLAESGVDYLVVDWTNQLWDKEHFHELGDHAREIAHATALALETLASMRDEGLRVPRVVLYLGVNNGPSTTMTAVNEEMAWIHEHFLRNPRYAGLFLEYLGKPLMMIHNGAGPNWLEAHAEVPVNDRNFTIRWQASQLEQSGFDQHGYWSWMDSTLKPTVTYFEGEPECMTISTAFFGPGGWKADTAYGRRGGWTYLEGFKSALRHRPRFVELHQYQEFAGQHEGDGYGPNHDIYVDSYSVEFSDDIEPVSLTAPAYRGAGGWGFFYLNLTRALVDLYRQETPETTVVAVASPKRGDVVTSGAIDVTWTHAGKTPASFTIELNGNPVARHLQGTQARIDLGRSPGGPTRLTLVAEGVTARYRLSYTTDELPAAEPVPARVDVDFVLDRSNP